MGYFQNKFAENNKRLTYRKLFWIKRKTFDKIKINKNENFVTVPLSYNCIVYDNPDIDITCEINVVCYNGIEVNYECISNAVIFNIKGSGKIDVKMSLVANSQIYYNFTIIKKWFCLYMLNFKLTC